MHFWKELIVIHVIFFMFQKFPSLPKRYPNQTVSQTSNSERFAESGLLNLVIIYKQVLYNVNCLTKKLNHTFVPPFGTLDMDCGSGVLENKWSLCQSYCQKCFFWEKSKKSKTEVNVMADLIADKFMYSPCLGCLTKFLNFLLNSGLRFFEHADDVNKCCTCIYQ